jgi:predicted Rossmann fold flavoprotein
MKNQATERRGADVLVIGGGPAGMMAAASAAERGLQTVVLERNDKPAAPSVLRKLGITGKGRCNLTNNCAVRECVQNIPTNGKFLYSALTAFPPQAVMSLFESLGVPLKTERGQRVFPQSDRAADIVGALRAYVRTSGAELVTGRADRIETENGRVTAVWAGERRYPCRAAVIATGGMSYPVTGSTGDGYALARALGHTIAQPRPSLVPLESPDECCRQMQGLSLRNVTVKAVDETGKTLYSELGEMLFTHFGVSGPLVLSASAHLRDFEHHSYALSIDLKPGLDEQKLDARLQRDFTEYANRNFETVMGGLVNGKMVPVAVQMSGIPGDRKCNAITRQERQELIRLLKAFPVRLSGPRPIDEAIVTSGGVNVKEIDPRTMQSRMVDGLYFAGEVIDADGYTGGFNLQIAWSTGRTAGRAVCGG